MTSRSEPTDKTPISRETAGLAMGLLGVVIFGGTLPATRIALDVYSPWFITNGRATLASAAAILCLVAFRRAIPWLHLPALFGAGVLLVFAFPILSALALQTVPAAHGGVVLGILPLATSVFAALIGGERPSPLFWACGIAGALLVIAFALRDGAMTLSSGDLFLFASAVAASLGYVISGRVARVMPGWEVICWALVLTFPATVLGSVLTWEPGFAHAPPKVVAAFVYLGLGSMFLGFFAWNIGLATGGIARVSQVQLLQTFVTLGISAALLSETITVETILFACAVVAVVALGRQAKVVGAVIPSDRPKQPPV